MIWRTGWPALIDRTMATISCGDWHWANIDSLAYDAASANHWKAVAKNYMTLLGALARAYPDLRVRTMALDDSADFSIVHDLQRDEYVLRPR